MSLEGVIKLLKGLNPSKALRPDELNSLRKVLKELANELGPVFVHLLQQSLDTCQIPKNGFLQTFVPSLRKRVYRALACNNRLVSLTCVLCKLFEHIVCSKSMLA